MAKSIKLGSDTYLDASGIVGIRGTIRSGNLDDYRTKQQSGWWYIATSNTAITNCPAGASYSHLCVVTTSNGVDTDAVNQVIVNLNGIWYRTRSGSPIRWSHWFKLTGTDTGS